MPISHYPILMVLMHNHAEARYAYASPTGAPGPRADIHGHPKDGAIHEHPHEGSHDHDDG